MSWSYECTDRIMRQREGVRRVLDPEGRYWYVPRSQPLAPGWSNDPTWRTR